MKQISRWALQHRITARLLILLCYLLLNATAFIIGSLINPLPLWFSWLITLPFLIALLSYPSRKRKSEYRNFYHARKASDLVLAACTFLLIVSSVSRYGAVPHTTPQNAAIASMQAPAAEKPGKKKFTIHFNKKGFFAKHWKKIKTHVREIRAALLKPGGAGKAALIILTILGAIVLLYVVAALSCSIACSGAEGLAFTVALLGTGLVVFLTVVVIRRIQHGPKKLPEPEPIEDAH
jgi:hypothetical protein